METIVLFTVPRYRTFNIVLPLYGMVLATQFFFHEIFYSAGRKSELHWLYAFTYAHNHSLHGKLHDLQVSYSRLAESWWVGEWEHPKTKIWPKHSNFLWEICQLSQEQGVAEQLLSLPNGSGSAKVHSEKQ